MKRVGLIGWRGMVGSVLMGRMQQERDFDRIDPVFFTTSQVGGTGPSIGKDVPALKDAKNIAELKALDIIIRNKEWIELLFKIKHLFTEQFFNF